MSKKAEQKANERWPIHPWTVLPKEGEHGEIVNFDEWLDDYRIWIQSFSANQGYVQGYEQAEKDLALTWEDIHKLVIIEDSLIHELCIKDDTIPTTQSFYEEVLKRFNKSKEEKWQKKK